MSCDCNRKNKITVLLGLTAGLIVLCIIVSSITSSFLIKEKDWSHHDEENAHQWLHKELNLSPEEEGAIDVFELEYRHERAVLQEQFQLKIEDLREHIIHSDDFSEEAKLKIHELHIVHGQLQELSIRHYYQMLHVLPPDKQAKLRKLAVSALSIPQ